MRLIAVKKSNIVIIFNPPWEFAVGAELVQYKADLDFVESCFLHDSASGELMQFSYSLPHFLWDVFDESGDGVDNLLFLVDPCDGVDDLLLIGLSLGSDNFAKLVVGDEHLIFSFDATFFGDDIFPL